MKKNIIALVPLRGGSKGIPKKNIKKIFGKPLCAWVLEAAINAKEISQIYVSTDSIEIAEEVIKIDSNIKVLKRNQELSMDFSTTESVMIDVMNRINFDVMVTIQATSPLTTSEDLDAAIRLFNEANYDSMLTAVRSKRFYWHDNGEPINYDPYDRPRRQDFKGTLLENGAFYITCRDILLKKNCRLGGKIGIFEMSQETAIEIDEMEDWIFVENLLRSRK
jgi:CMP-N-acetylneuraminic acid synthetase